MPLEIIGEPLGGLRVQAIPPERRLLREQRHLALGLGQRRGGLQGDKTAPDHHNVFLNRRHFADRQRVPGGIEVKHVAQQSAGDLRPARAAPGGQERLAEFHDLPVLQHRQPPLDIELPHHGAETHFDVIPRKPLRRGVQEVLDGHAGGFEEFFRQKRAMVGGE